VKLVNNPELATVQRQRIEQVMMEVVERPTVIPWSSLESLYIYLDHLVEQTDIEQPEFLDSLYMLMGMEGIAQSAGSFDDKMYVSRSRQFLEKWLERKTGKGHHDLILEYDFKKQQCTEKIHPLVAKLYIALINQVCSIQKRIAVQPANLLAHFEPAFFL
jgi:hypothetical protein